MRASPGRWLPWVGAVLLGALGLWWLSGPRAAAGGEGPIVIGALQALSGPSAALEAPVLAATQVAVDEINEAGGLLGRRVELRVEDSRGDPRTAAAAAERLIADSHAVALFGCGSAACRLAVKPVVETRRHLLFYPQPSDGMEQSPHIVYTGATPNQQVLPATDWAMRRFGRRVYLIGLDDVYQRRVGAVLRDYLALVGATFTGERLITPASPEVGELLADLRERRPDLVVSLLPGAANRALFDGLAAAEMGHLPLLSLGAAEPEMKAYGGGRLDRHFTAWSYLESLPGAANEKFLRRLRALRGEGASAGDTAMAAYVGVHLWAAAVREVRSPRTDAVNANVPLQTVVAPLGFAAVDTQSRHLWRQLRIAQVQVDGQLTEVLTMPRYIRPQPWPAFRSTGQWATRVKGGEGMP